MSDITKELAHAKVDISPLSLVKNEPSAIKKKVGFQKTGHSSFNQRADSDYEASVSDCPATHIKVEVLDDAPLSEDEGSVGPGCSSYTAAVTKQELDIGSTELQRPDMYFTLQQVKEEMLQGQELPVLEGEEFTQQPDNDLLLRNSPGSLPTRVRGPMSQQIHRVEAAMQSAHMDASKKKNPKIGFLAHTSGVAAVVVPHDATHRDSKNISTYHSNNPLSNVFHTSERPFECKFSGKRFTSRSNLTKHVRIHTGEKPFECASCDKRFGDKSSLTRHTRLHTGEKPFECESCDKRFSDSSALTKHKHKRLHTVKKAFKCKFCCKSLSDISSLVNHICVHTENKRFECKFCYKRLSCSSNLIKHMRIHTGEKPFECKSCGNRFGNSSILTRHTRLHTGEKSFECKFCYKKFIDSYSLAVHIRVHTGEKPFECKFSIRSALTRHIRLHTGEKPFECKFCSKKFSDRSNLANHIRVHTGERPFECRSCCMRFARISTLTTHMHTCKKPFQ